MSVETLAKSIVKRLYMAGHTAYFAGGWVRDHLLEIPCDDIDIATSATPEEVMALFEKVVPVGIKFGSVVVVEEGINFEVTTFRSEGPYLDGRHPSSVTISDAEHDAQRRSITINGMFYDPLEEKVIDYVGGQEDLKAGLIRAIGDPVERYKEDKLRMIRAARFAVRFDFSIDPPTEAAIRKLAPQLTAVSIERIVKEFDKMKGPKFGLFLEKLLDLGLLQVIFPEVQSLPPHLGELPSEAPTLACVLELFPNATLEKRLEVGRRLKVSKKDLQFAQLLFELEHLDDDPVHLVHFFAQPQSDLALRFKRSDLKSDGLEKHIERKRTNQPLVRAEDLKMAPGPAMGEMLRKAERIAIEKNLEDKESVLRELGLPSN